ncbi:MAG: TRAP transporter small permease subunit [Proteobacteria bacterium]|nr:TRAP transporter small permease subunit [Pseudomonadota bacterium]MBU4297031.1 TRAP transporter small permease subunit [Pseudomonadota bacterium]
MQERPLYTYLRAICRAIDGVNFWLGRGVAWLTVLVVLVVFANVLLRYLLHSSFVFMQELEWHLFAMIFLLGGGYTLLKDGHVRVDIFYQRLSARGRAWLNLIGVLVFLLPGCYLVISTSIPFVNSSLQMLEGSPNPGGMPYRFILKSMIPLGFLLIALQGVALGLRSVLTLTGGEIDE